MENKETRINWKINDIIRHRLSGHPYLIIHISRYACTVVDLESHESPLPSFTLLPRNYSDYARDRDLELKKNGEFTYHPITL